MPPVRRCPHDAKYSRSSEQPNGNERVSRSKRQKLHDGDDAMIKTFYAIVVSAIAAGCVVAFPILSEQVRATPPVQVLAPTAVEAPTTAMTCGQNAWPYLDAACLRNAGGESVQTRDVRLVAADRRSGAR
jgi:pseudouridine-5'-phosphate glycosidase